MIDVKRIARDYESLISIFLFGGSVGAFIFIDTFPGASAIFPRMVTGLAILLTAILVVKASMRSDGGRERVQFFINIPRFAIGSGVMFLYLLSVNHVGYFTSTALFIPILAYLLSYKKLISSIILTAIYIAAIYLIFVVIFKTTLPPEIILQFLLGS